VKTTLTSKKDKSQFQKLFINICSCKIVKRPSFETKQKDSQQGQSWSFPYSAGKIRYDQDNHSAVCNTIDVAFHPYAFELCNKDLRFQEFLVSSALEAAQI